MIINTGNNYPVFVSGQLLTSDNLNATRDYLDANIRVNRKTLNGIGVISGFEVWYDKTTDPDNHVIRISKGMGITSEGYIISQETDMVYGFFQEDYENISNYSFWNDNTVPSTPVPFNILELRSDGAGGSISELEDAEEKVVVLFLELTQQELDFCISSSGDFGGAVKNFRLRVLLVNKDDLDLLNEFNNKTFVKRDDILPTLKVKRFHTSLPVVSPPLTAISDISEYSQIQETYVNLVDGYKATLGNALITFYNNFHSYFALNFFEAESPEQDFATFINTNLSYNSDLTGSSNAAVIQYVFSYIKDLTDTYTELSENAYESFKDFAPDNITLPDFQFPLHLSLGALVPYASVVSPVEKLYTDKYRHVFVQLLYAEGKERNILKAQLLFEKIILMIKSFSISDDFDLPLLITPSRSELTHLSRRAIPAYYNLAAYPQLIDLWNGELFIRNKSDQEILSYHFNSANVQTNVPGLVVPDHIANPFNYDINQYDFLRIEGHIGKALSGPGGVLESLNNLKRSLNLNFDIATLKLSTDFPIPLDFNVSNYDFGLFHHYVYVYPGVEHTGGTQSGGTFILVTDDADNIVADFSLPAQSLNV